MEEKYKSAFDRKVDKDPEVKEVKKEAVVEMLLRLLRGHGHIFNSYEIKLMEGESSAKKIVETYTDVKASRKLYPQAFEDKK